MERPSDSPSPADRERAIIAVALDAIVSMDHCGLVTEFNPAAEKMFGYARKDALGRPLAELIIPPRLRDAHRKGLSRYLATGDGPVIGKRIELTAIRAGGEEFPIEIAICRIPSSQPPTFTGFIRDLSESRRAAEALRLAEERAGRLEAEAAVHRERERADSHSREADELRDRLITMLQATPDFVGFADARSARVLWVNRAGRRMCGISEDADLTNLSIADFHPDWAYRKLTEEGLPAAARDGHWSGEIAFHHRDGREVPTLMILMAHRGATGEVEIFSTISRDISERRQAEEVKRELAREQTARLIAEEAVRIRDDFVAIAGHELKTPLTALLMQVQSIRRAHAGNRAQSEERVERIARSAQRLESLINQLLDVSRIGAGRLELEPEEVDLGALVEEVVHRFADASAQAGSLITVQGAPSIQGDWDRLRIDQVLTNLLSNAIKYGQGHPIEIEMQTDGADAVVRVTDQGIGIDPQNQRRIFERFERAVAARQYGGLGLGLWISRQIVEAAGGSITVDSQPGRGSTFTLRLPLHAEARPHAA